MAIYRAVVLIKTEETVEPSLIDEYLIDVLTTMPFDSADPAFVVSVVKE